MSQTVRKRDVSPLENCGFVLHFLTLPLVIVFALWVILPEETLHEWDITYYPDKSWAVYIPTAIICSCVGILVLNGAMNVLVTPKPDSIDTMWDEHSRPYRQQTIFASSGNASNQQDSSLPDICDIDVGVISDMMQQRQQKSQPRTHVASEHTVDHT